MAAMHDSFGNAVNERIVIGTINFVFDIDPYPAQSVTQDANHMWRTANRITILQTRTDRPGSSASRQNTCLTATAVGRFDR